jgi:uncharacterized protein YutE (UPF0331/DUF86 family)
MLEKDAILSKTSIIKRCLDTIKRTTGLMPEGLNDVIVQDVFVLNVQRSIQACIDIANILIAENGWKLPSSYKESFSIIYDKKVIPENLGKTMMKMCGFRNIAVHDYQQITSDIMKSILVCHLKDFEDFYTEIFKYINNVSNRHE